MHDKLRFHLLQTNPYYRNLYNCILIRRKRLSSHAIGRLSSRDMNYQFFYFAFSISSRATWSFLRRAFCLAAICHVSRTFCANSIIFISVQNVCWWRQSVHKNLNILHVHVELPRLEFLSRLFFLAVTWGSHDGWMPMTSIAQITLAKGKTFSRSIKMEISYHRSSLILAMLTVKSIRSPQASIFLLRPL